jgi:hypothetical protein
MKAQDNHGMILSPGAKQVSDAPAIFPFRPWVRRAGWSIVLTAVAVTAAIVLALMFVPSARYGWFGERFVWVYIITLWIGGARIWSGTYRPVAEVKEELLVLRPLHQFRTRLVAWSAIRGTEQTIGGDRLIVWYDTPRGPRFVALNLNLVKGRRDFLALLDRRLGAIGFAEKIVERSRWMSKG